MKYPRVAIIFPTYNGWSDTRKCLESIAKLDYPKTKLEVIIVDNGSTDGTPRAAEKFAKKHSLKFVCGTESLSKKKADRVPPVRLNSDKPTISLIENRINLGFAKAVNQGAKKATGKYLLITNNDVVFEKNCLKELVKTSDNDPKIGVVGGRVYWQDRHHLSIDGFRLNPYLAYHQFDLSGIDQKRECDWVSGHCFLIKKKLFLDFGGFDEKYFFYFEDIDLSLRIRRAGYRLSYCPKAIVYHGYGKTIMKQKMGWIFYLGYRSRWRCVLKNATPLQVLTSSIFLLTLAPLYQSYLTRYNVYLPMLRGLKTNLKELPEIIKLRKVISN